MMTLGRARRPVPRRPLRAVPALLLGLAIPWPAAGVAPTPQDCAGAIPVCMNHYSQTLSFSGTGNVANEITPSISCLGSGEKNDVW